MKRILLIAFLAVSLGLPASGPVQLKSFQSILDGLTRGASVRAVFHYARCRMIRDNKEAEKVPDAIGGMTLDTFEYFAPGSVGNKEGFIASSHGVLISHPRYGYVLNHVKVRIHADGNVRIIARYLDPRSLEVRMDESFYTRIDTGSHTTGAEFFRIP